VSFQPEPPFSQVRNWEVDPFGFPVTGLFSCPPTSLSLSAVCGGPFLVSPYHNGSCLGPPHPPVSVVVLNSPTTHVPTVNTLKIRGFF